MIAPPRFVRCSSMSPFDIVSDFSAKVAMFSAGLGEGEVAATTGAEALGDAAVTGASAAVAAGDGAATIGAGGGRCVAV